MPTALKKIAAVFLIVNLLTLNIFVGFLFYRELTVKTQNQLLTKPSSLFQDNLSENERVVASDGCGKECRVYIDQAVDQLVPTQAEVEKEGQIQPVADTKTLTKRVAYVPIPGSGSTLENDWTDIAGTDFYLSKVDYPGFLEAYFEATFKLFNGNGIAYVRLYDVSHGIAVQDSEVSTSSQASTFISSGNISLWEGNNLYRVQIKSLTADTTIFESARLKIISEN